MSLSLESPSRALVQQPGAGELLNVVGERIRILAASEATGGACTVFEETTAPGQGPPLHRHEREDEFFAVLEGTAKFSIDGREVSLAAGAFAAVPCGVVHTFCNAGTTPLRMLITCVPGGIEAGFREVDRLGRSGRIDAEAIAGALRRIGIEITGPPLT